MIQFFENRAAASRYSLAALLVLGAGLSSAHAETPNREGFTLTLNLGVAAQSVQPEKIDGETEVGLGGLNLGLGGFINPEMAVLFRISGSTTTQEVVENVDATYFHAYAGPSFQYFVTDWLRLEVGLGMALARVRAETTINGNRFKVEADEQGFGALFAGAVTVWQNADHQLYVGAEVTPGFFEDFKVLTSAVVFGWQLF